MQLPEINSYFDQMQLLDDLEWGLLATTQMLNGLGADVKVNALSIDDQWIVIACSNDKIYVFNARTGLYARTLAGHNGEITCLVLVSATEQDNLDDNHTTINTALETSTQISHGTVKGFGNKSAIVVSGSLDGDLRIWDLASGQSRFICHSDSILSLCVKDGTKYAITGSYDGKISICSIDTGYRLFDDQAFIKPVRFLQAAGQSFLSATHETTKVWDLETSDLQTYLTNHKDEISAIGYDGRFQVSCSANFARVFDNNSKKEYTIQTEGEVTCVQMNESDFIFGLDDGTLKSLCLATGKITQSFHHGQRSITCLSADKRFLASGCDHGSVKIWSLQSGCLLYEFCKESQKIYKVCIKNGKCVILCKRGGKTMMEIVNFLPLGNLPLAKLTTPTSATTTVADDVPDVVPDVVLTAASPTAPNGPSPTAPNVWSSTNRTSTINPALVMNQQGTTTGQELHFSLKFRIQLSDNDALVHVGTEDNSNPVHSTSLS